MLDEKRKYVRVKADIEFIYKPRSSKDPEKKGVTENISPCGIMGLVDKGVKTSDWLELKLHMPRLRTPIPATGKVVWTTEGKAGKIKAGIKFEEINPEMKNKFLESMCELMFSELERLNI
ncbi:PilZ domain-containing protein [Candidatus Omnitrophota bacterium]